MGKRKPSLRGLFEWLRMLVHVNYAGIGGASLNFLLMGGSGI